MKHAYLIMAHGDFYVLKKLLMLIDHPQNDIYLHIDKKTKGFFKEDLENILKYSKIF